MKEEDITFLKHILENISLIEKSTKSMANMGELEDDKDILDATLRRIEVIGAVKNLSDDLRIKYPGIEWKKITGARDIIIHAYFRVDIDVVWDIVKDKIPKLKKAVEGILNDINSEKKEQEKTKGESKKK